MKKAQNGHTGNVKIRQVYPMKTNDYVKYMTQTIVKYADQPKEERKRLRLEKKENKASLWYRLFGILPYILYIEVQKRRKTERKRSTAKVGS